MVGCLPHHGTRLGSRSGMMQNQPNGGVGFSRSSLRRAILADRRRDRGSGGKGPVCLMVSLKDSGVCCKGFSKTGYLASGGRSTEHGAQSSSSIGSQSAPKKTGKTAVNGEAYHAGRGGSAWRSSSRPSGTRLHHYLNAVLRSEESPAGGKTGTGTLSTGDGTAWNTIVGAYSLLW